ncbi:MAG: HEAT repeat domain-containing protein [Pirellulales bacterium]|nr:HEAT repeat domain-containing protein [Pirellulales bacterium]
MRALAAAGTLAWLAAASAVTAAPAPGANRFVYLDESDPFYVSAAHAKLTTPQWVGEPNVEAVVVLAIDDLRDPPRWEAYLRPIIERLKKLTGSAPVSIMTCKVAPTDPQLQAWLAEGLSLECHTIDHPCVLLNKGNFARAKQTYDDCIGLLSYVPGNRPVAFRVPCCDSLNAASPRFYREIFNRTAAAGSHLSIDSSVFQLFTPADPALPRDLVLAADGSERFRRYLPNPGYVATVENYPYPYPIGRLCWEFPCAVPSDWQGQKLYRPANPEIVVDMKRALDAVVAKRGVFNLVFHPYDWIRSSQVVELIDHAVARHKGRVKFLTFREALERLNRHLLGDEALRGGDGGDNGVRLLDLNGDGFQDVVIGNQRVRGTRVWDAEKKSWLMGNFPCELVGRDGGADRRPTARFGMVGEPPRPVVLAADDRGLRGWRYEASNESVGRWVEAPDLTPPVDGAEITATEIAGLRLVDIDGAGGCELLLATPTRQVAFAWEPGSADKQRSKLGRWRRLDFTLPTGAMFADDRGRDAGLRLVDLDDDLDLDVIFSNEREFGAYLFADLESGWSRAVRSGPRTQADAVPMIARAGTDNGAWFHGRELIVQNEDTDRLPDAIQRLPFNDLLAGVVPEPKSPTAAQRALVPRPDMIAELVAAEPLIEDPVSFDWDTQGRLWVIEMRDYPSGVDGRPGGRVRVLDDTDGDGRYDRSSIFLDELRYPTSVFTWRKGALVLAAPDLLYAEDRDGDGQADHTEVLFTGFARGNPQHLANGLVWGLDNWIYGANGDSGGRVRAAAGGEENPIGGRDFRLRPADGSFEPIEGFTQFSRPRDDWGNWFGCSNANPFWQYVLSDHYLRRNPHVAGPDSRVDVSDNPGVAPVYPLSRLLERFNDPHTANRFTSACGATIYRDELLGASFTGNVFISEPVHSLVHREIMAAEGVRFVSRRAADEQRSEFLASTDNFFRPTTIKTGPDGALWIADMYRYVIEHPEWIPAEMQEKLDLRSGSDKGRIYRVYPIGAEPRPIPKLAQLDTAGLVAALESANGWVRDKAQQLLVECGGQDAVAALETLVRTAPRPTARLHALCTLDGLAVVSGEILTTALSDSHPGVRRHAVRIAEAQVEASPAVAAALLRLVEDSDPLVQLQLAYSLGQWTSPAAGEALGRLAVLHADDPWITAAVLSSAPRNLNATVAAVLSASGNSPLPAEIAAQLLAIAAAMGRADAIVELVPAISRDSDGRYAHWQLTALGELLNLLDRRNKTLVQFRDEAPEPLQSAVGQLAGLFVFARRVAADAEAEESLRLAALDLLGRGFDNQSEDIAILTTLLGPQASPELQAAAIRALGRLSIEEVPSRLLAAWRSYSPSARSEVLSLLVGRSEWAERLLDAISQGVIAQGELDLTRQQQLREHRNRELRQRAMELLGQASSGNRQAVVAQYQPAAQQPGDAARGAEHFNRKCAVCHRFRDQGHAVGPDLSALTDKSPAALLLAILDPNRAVENKFVNYTAVTTAGLSFTGLLSAETGNSVVLLGQEGKQQTILRDDLEALESTGKSLMPEEFEKDLTPTDINDVIAYMRAEEAPRKVLAGNEPAVVRPEALRGYIFCLPTNAEVYGPNLVIEEPHGNLGWWTAENDRAAWTLEVPRETNYTVFLDIACDEASAGNNWLLELSPAAAEAAAGDAAGKTDRASESPPVGADAPSTDQRLTGKVESTGDWNTYRRVKIGEMHLKAGRFRLGLRSNGQLAGPLFDLKGITFIPQGRWIP